LNNSNVFVGVGAAAAAPRTASANTSRNPVYQSARCLHPLPAAITSPHTESPTRQRINALAASPSAPRESRRSGPTHTAKIGVSIRAGVPGCQITGVRAGNPGGLDAVIPVGSHP
jgi:hypothetical protein